MRVCEDFVIHDELNPLLFDGKNKLYSNIKEKIIDIVDEFISTLDVPVNVLDIRIVGSNASYNYTIDSDIDVHIVIDSDDYSDEDLLMAYCNAKRNIFRDKYEITIKNLPVELSVEDTNSNVVSNGIYSVTEDKWVKFPQHIDNVDIDVSREVDSLKNKIEKLLRDGADVDELHKMMSTIKMMRKNSIAADGEFGKGNYIFKGLRDLGIIKALKDKIKEEKSKQLSLESVCKDCFRV